MPVLKCQILLHIGLPKTATTSLQHNIFMVLHQQNKVNFLGKRYQYNQFNAVFFQIKEQSLNQTSLKQLRVNLEPFLLQDKLNIISEENISVSFISNFKVIFANLAQLFIDDDLQVISSLRQPTDYLFSHFVEDYYWRFFADKKRNTFAKFSQELLTYPHHNDYKMYFLESYLTTLQANFNQLTILLFEDIEHDLDYYLSQLNKCLSIKLPSYCLLPKINTKQSIKSGKYSKAITLERIIDYYWSRLPRFIRFLAQKILIIKWIKNLIIINTKKHPYPNAQTQQKLMRLLCVKNNDFAKKFKLDNQKLKKYRYFL